MIVVTGMHRSGTSLVCQLLHRAGLDLGEAADPFPTDRWNEAGYFESRAVMDVNSELVTGLARNRSRLEALLSKLRYVTMPDRKGRDRRAARLEPRIRELAEQHRNGALKDPRFCLTLPYWQGVTEVERVIVCLRHPAAVVDSLRRRDRLPRALGYRFYDYHMASLLELLPIERTELIDVDSIVEGRGGRELAALCAFLELDADLEALAGEVVRPGSYRCRGSATGSLPAPTRRIWERLESLAERRRGQIAEPKERAAR